MDLTSPKRWTPNAAKCPRDELTTDNVPFKLIHARLEWKTAFKGPPRSNDGLLDPMLTREITLTVFPFGPKGLPLRLHVLSFLQHLPCPG